MKYTKRAITFMLASSALLVGCGGDTTIIITDMNDSNSSTAQTTLADSETDTTNTNTSSANGTDNQTLVKVIDGYIINSTVKDSNGSVADYDKEKNLYLFKNIKGDFISARGGIVDVDGKLDSEDDRRWFKTDINGDGIGDKDGNEYVLEAPSSYSVITPLTTIVAHYMKEQNLSLANAEKAVSDLFGLYQEDIKKDPYSYDNELKDRTKTALTIMELVKRWKFTSTLSTKATTICVPGMDCTPTDATTESNTTTTADTTSADAVCLPGFDCASNTTATASTATTIETTTTSNTDCLPGQDCIVTESAGNSYTSNVTVPDKIIKFNDGEDIVQFKATVEDKVGTVKLKIENSNKTVVEVLKDYEKAELGVETIPNSMIFTN